MKFIFGMVALTEIACLGRGKGEMKMESTKKVERSKESKM